MAENNINEQLQGEMSEEELDDIAGGRKIYNKKYDVYVDPVKKTAYVRTYHVGRKYTEIRFQPKYLEGLDI